MKYPRNYLVIIIASLQMAPATVRGDDDYPAFSMGGLLFGDFYHVPSHHLPEGDGATGAVLRRAYLTFDAVFSPDWSGRLRFEANQAGTFETYEYEVDFKDLYLDWKLDGHEMMAGLEPTLTYDVIEAHWGLRHLMRTPMDLQGVASRDTGISVKGPLGDSGSWSYRAMYGSGIKFGADSSDSEKWMGALNWAFAPGWMLDLYADVENLTDDNDRNTIQAFVGRQTGSLRWGIQYSHQDRSSDDPLELASTYLVKNLDERSSLIGRIDRIIEPSPRGNNISYIPFDPSAPATMFIAGYEYQPNEHFRITPNAIVIRYDRNDEGVRPDTDVHLRLTLFVDFE